MRISVLGPARDPSPRARALLNSLAAAGHEVGLSTLARRRWGRLRLVEHTVWRGGTGLPSEASRRPRPEIVFPATSRLVEAADDVAGRLQAWVARRPDWTVPRRDLIGAAPLRPELSVPVGQAVPEREPWLVHAGPTPPGRHRGRSVVLCYRSTPASPAHHLRAALERAGVEVVAVDHLDFSRLPRVDAIAVVESPTPPIPVSGPNPGIPVVFWVHHGEHHLEGNIRLSRTYGADLVLLAHSWHLALRFDRRVERFPFGAEPSPPPPPFPERRWDLAFVGAVDGSAYARRRQLLAEAERELAAVRVASGIPPDAVDGVYRNSRSVLNEGGDRHLPITMRVFEATGAGALLVTDPAPGLDLISGGNHREIGTEGLDAPALRAALTDGSGEALARAAHRLTQDRHTYDHRVDLLFRFIETIEHEERPVAADPSPVGRFLASHPYGQRLLDLTGEVEASDREVWHLEDLSDEPKAGSFDTVVMDRESPPERALTGRRFVVGVGLDPGRLPVTPRSVRGIGELVVIDVGGPGYDVETVGGLPPPAGQGG